MKFNGFKLERFFAKYEFNVKYTLSSSDCETLKVAELLALAGDDMKEKWHDLSLGYTESKGYPLLLAEIAKLYDGIPSENILAVVPQEGGLIALSSILEKGDHVICMSPAYQSLSEVPRALGCEVSDFPVIKKEDRWELDLEMLKGLIKKETRLLILNIPHNPTGYLPSRETFDEIVAIARKNGIYIFSDEMYRLSELDEADRLPSMAAVYEKGVSLSGLSKSFGLPGLRTGWLVTQDDKLFRQFLVQKDYTTICGSAPGEVLAVMALRAKDVIIKRNLAIIRENIGHAASFFSQHSGKLAWTKPKAGSVAFAQFLGGLDAEKISIDLINEKSLLILSGNFFDYDRSFFRLGLGRKSFKTGLELFDDFIAGTSL